MAYFVGIFFLFLITRLLPYFFSSVPTGYDAGLYLYLFRHAPEIPRWLTGSYYSALFYALTPLVRLLTDPSVILIPLQLIAALFLFFALNWSIKTMMNKNQRLFTLFLFTISAIQFRMFWFYYVKNMFALGLLLLFLNAIIKKKNLYAILLGTLVGIIHLPTFLILVLICVVECAIHPNKLKITLIYIFCLCVTLIFNIPVYSISILPYIRQFLEGNRIVQPFAKADWGGTFYDLLPSISLMAVYIWLPMYSYFKNRKIFNEFVKTPYFSGLIATSILVLGQFLFFRRFIPLWDIFIIIAAGYCYKNILSMKYFYPILTALFILVFIFRTGMPLKTISDINELQKSQITKNSYILSTSKEDTAWIMGYTNAKVIAWNFGGYSDLLSESDWNRFYVASSREEYNAVLKKLPHPLYVYVSEKESPRFSVLLQSKLLKKVSNQVYEVVR